MKWISVLVFLSLSTQTCWAGSADYDFPRMREFMLELKATHALPTRDFEPSSVEPAAERLDPRTQALFEDMETQIFGRVDLIRLESCKDCEAFSDYARHTIFIQPSTINEIRTSYGPSEALIVIQFILAHEFGHFIQEASIGQGRSPILSLNNKVSLFNFFVGAPDDEISGRMAHAEVDAYAFLILKARLSHAPTELLTYYTHEIELTQASPDQDAPLVIGDLDFRLQQTRRLLKELW